MVDVLPPSHKPTPEGMVKTPLKTMFMPFPFVEKNIMADMEKAEAAGDTERVARLEEIKAMMGRTKEHDLHATNELKEGEPGKMYGQPFIHIMFGNIEMQASH